MTFNEHAASTAWIRDWAAARGLDPDGPEVSMAVRENAGFPGFLNRVGQMRIARQVLEEDGWDEERIEARLAAISAGLDRNPDSP